MSHKESKKSSLNVKMENMLQRFSFVSISFKPPWIKQWVSIAINSYFWCNTRNMFCKKILSVFVKLQTASQIARKQELFAKSFMIFCKLMDKTFTGTSTRIWFLKINHRVSTKVTFNYSGKSLNKVPFSTVSFKSRSVHFFLFGIKYFFALHTQKQPATSAT